MARPRVGWIVQNQGVTLMDADGACLESIPYPQAAVWDSLVKGYSLERCVSLFAVVAGVDSGRAGTSVAECLSSWTEQRYIEVR
jgi:hypothetical protein